MKLLELFSGTGSVGKVANKGLELISLDLKDADINWDLLNGDYKTCPIGYFDVIPASPPCTEYSKALATRTRNIPNVNDIVLKCLEIIDYVTPDYSMIENPQTGLLKSQSFMETLPYNDMDCCNMVCHTESEHEFEIIYKHGNHNHYVTTVVGTCMVISTKKQRNEFHKERMSHGTIDNNSNNVIYM
jgi:hypothetical protein